MLKTDDTWKSGIISNGRYFVYRFLANGADAIASKYVTSCTIDECGASEHKLKVGEFCKSSVELSVLTSAYNKWANGYLQIYISCNGSAEVSLGKFWIYKSELKDDGRYTKLTGYDVPEYMIEKADPASTDVAAIVSAIEADSGMKVINKSVFTLKSITAFPEGTTNMQLLGYIAGYSGYNLRTDRNGNIEAYRYQDTDDILLVPKEDLYPSEDLFPDTPVITSSDAITGFVIPRRNTFSGSQSYAADPIYVNSIIVTNGTESYTVGAGSSIMYENPFITSADQIDQSYIGTSYVPLNNSWRGNPAVQIGDVLMVETAENEFQRVLVMEQKLTLDGGFSATLCCYGETDAAIASVESPTMREIKAAKKTLTDALLEALTTILGAGAGYFNFVDKDGNVITSSSHDATIAGWQITDSPTVTESTKGWRFLLGGLYYSSNGFKTAKNFALTDEGQIVANSITTGTIQDAAGNNYWNLDTGEFSLKALTNYSTTEEMSAAIKASADGISSTVSGLSTKVDSNTEAISDNAKAISDTSAGLASANTKITENSSAITQNANQISSVVSSVEKVSDSVDRANDAISRNSETISENTSKIEQASNQINLVVAQQGYSNLLLNSNFTDPANYFKYWSVFGYTGTSYVYDADFPDKHALQINKTNTTYGDPVIQEVNFNASLSKKYINLYLYAKITDPGTQGNTLSAAVRLDYSDGNSDFLGPSASETMTTGVLYKLRFSWLVSSDSVVTKITPRILYCDASHTQKAEINNCMMFISALDKPAPAGTWTDKGNNDLISQINLAPSGVKIAGDKVEIETTEFTFGKDPNTITMKTDSANNGISFTGTGQIKFNTTGIFDAINKNTVGGHPGSRIKMANDLTNSGQNYINLMNYIPGKSTDDYYTSLGNAVYITSNADTLKGNTLMMQNYLTGNSAKTSNEILLSSVASASTLSHTNYTLSGAYANVLRLMSENYSNGAQGNHIDLSNYDTLSSRVLNRVLLSSGSLGGSIGLLNTSLSGNSANSISISSNKSTGKTINQIAISNNEPEGYAGNSINLTCDPDEGNSLTLQNYQKGSATVTNGKIIVKDSITLKAQNWLAFYACGGDRRVVFKGLQKFEVNGVDILAKLNIAAQGAQTM